jgi:hypothetical protein
VQDCETETSIQRLKSGVASLELPSLPPKTAKECLAYAKPFHNFERGLQGPDPSGAPGSWYSSHLYVKGSPESF